MPLPMESTQECSEFQQAIAALEKVEELVSGLDKRVSATAECIEQQMDEFWFHSNALLECAMTFKQHRVILDSLKERHGSTLKERKEGVQRYKCICVQLRKTKANIKKAMASALREFLR